MITVRLPDGKSVPVAEGTTLADALRQADARVGRETVAARVADRIVDLATPLYGDAETPVQPLTASDPDGLYVTRHSCAHVMAEAICALWPGTKLVYGPPVDDGFYYDIDCEHHLTPDDFAKIEAKMAEIVAANRPFTRYELPRADALTKLQAEGNPYKVDNAERAEGDMLSFYVSGPRDSGCFEDLCRGPHVPTTGRVGAYKVMQVAGAYWHGDVSQKMLQRVYGTAWPSKKELQAHLQRLEEAKKRDHRRIGPELGLFATDALVGTGLILWKPRGATVRFALESFIREELVRRGYQPVYTPHVGRLDLYRTSGHFPYYRDSQYPPLYENDTARILNELWIAAHERGAAASASAEERRLLEELRIENPKLWQQFVGDASQPASRRYQLESDADRHNLALVREQLQQQDGYLLKPMNCPHHIRIFASEPASYRDLPVRLAEFGTVYRYEQSGEVGGLTRVRGLTQDDAHIFCTPDQLQAELAGCVEMTKLVLNLVGLSDYRVRASLRDDSDKYVGSRENWEKAEAAILDVVKSSGMDWFVGRGEAAFYGPKIDFLVKDAIGREWQLGTVQCDYNLPERFDLKYIGDDNREHRPVMVHRAPLGSLERFIGILIEHFAGAFPAWLAPVQATVCTISDKASEYARRVHAACREAGLRVELDEGNDRIGAKIRRATLMKSPYILVVGEQEAAQELVNVRTREGQQLGSMPAAQFIAACSDEVRTRGVQRPLAGAGG
ncbi:MAG: threonine--tRNA ligase [Phycisphaerae bacterium]